MPAVAHFPIAEIINYLLVCHASERKISLRQSMAGVRILNTYWHGRIAHKLADDLAVAGVATHVLGDAQKCGNIRDAIGDGYKVACEL